MKLIPPLMLLLGATALQAEQRCDSHDQPLSSPTARFEEHADGTVTDRASKLMWMHCSAGQSWSPGQGCRGEPSLHSWASAQALADDVNLSGSHVYNDWRVPQLRELATITERQCANPRVNLEVFPGTPAAPYWSASTRRGAPNDAAAFALSFGADGVVYRHKGESYPVRLVRSAQ